VEAHQDHHLHQEAQEDHHHHQVDQEDHHHHLNSCYSKTLLTFLSSKKKVKINKELTEVTDAKPMP